MVWPRTTIFYKEIPTDMLYRHTGFDVNSYFRLEVIAKKLSNMLPTTPGGISWEHFKQESPNFILLLGTTGLTQLPDMAWLVWLVLAWNMTLNDWLFDWWIDWAACSLLQNAIKYCTKVHKTGAAGRSHIIWPLFNLESPNFARTYAPTYSIAALNMISPVSYSRSKFENSQNCRLR